MSAPRFPPPGNETGYRDIAIPTVTSRDAPIEKPRVVASRPEDRPLDEPPKPHLSDAAIRLQNARLAFRERERRRTTRILFALLVVAIALAMTLQIIRRGDRERRMRDAMRHAEILRNSPH